MNIKSNNNVFPLIEVKAKFSEYVKNKELMNNIKQAREDYKNGDYITTE